MNLGKRFKSYRQKHNLTQSEAAKALGIKSYQLANYESNRSEPNIKTLKVMSKLYHVSIDHLVGNSPIFESEEYLKMEKEEFDFEKLKKDLIEMVKGFGQEKE